MEKGLGEKFMHRFHGPYVVRRQLSPLNYEVQLECGRGKSEIVHVSKMKPYVNRGDILSW